MTKPLHWLVKNLSALVLAFILAAVVWVTAVVTNDPNQMKTTNPIPLKMKSQDPNMLLMNEVPSHVQLNIEAPTSVWTQIDSNPNLIQASVDLSGLGEGEHIVPVMVTIDINPVKIIDINPSEIEVSLEPLAVKNFPIQVIVTGELPLGYKKELTQVNPTTVRISGPESLVSAVDQARVIFDISGANQTETKVIDIEILDTSGLPVKGLNIDPKSVTVTQPISLMRGFRNVAVKVITSGQVANGFRVTNITVTPPTVTVSSTNPLLVNELPGFVETEPIDLSNLTDDIEVSVGLVLPEGISLIRDAGVFVQVGVAAIESSISMPLTIEILGLSPALEISVSPPSVEVIVSGPINVLETLSPASFRIVIDVTNVQPGVYQITPIMDIRPSEVILESMLPETVEVILQLAPTPTPTITPLVTPTATP